MSRKALLIYGCAFAMLVAVGCGPRNPVPSMDKLNDSNIKRLYAFYDMYKNAHGNVGPQSEEELKDYLNNDATAKLLVERMKVGNVDDVFVSDRDGQPFKIKWGAAGINNHAIIFEDVGVEGKRMVAFSSPRELDNSEYDKYWEMEVAESDDEPVGAGNIQDIMNQTDQSKGQR